MKDKDKQILEHMIRYCEEIRLAQERFGKDRETFYNDFVYYNSCCMSLMQMENWQTACLRSSKKQIRQYHGSRFEAYAIFLPMSMLWPTRVLCMIRWLRMFLNWR